MLALISVENSCSGFGLCIRLFVLSKRRSEQCSRFAGGQEGRIVSGPDRPNGVPSYPSPTPPRRPAVRRPDPTGPWCVRVLNSTVQLHSALPCSALLYSILLYSILLYSSLLYSFLLYSTLFFSDILCMKRVYREKTTIYWSAARNRERFSSR